MRRPRQALHAHGDEQLMVVGLAKACRPSRRALYDYFSNQAEAFRGVLAWAQLTNIEAGLAPGRRVLAEGGSALDVVVAVMVVRDGEARRILARSPHAAELTCTVFRRL